MPRKWTNAQQFGGGSFRWLEDELHTEWERRQTQRRVEQIRRDMRRATDD